MRLRHLVFRGLGYYWGTNAAVVVGVATAVAVLAGALLVGDSVRGSLRDLVRQRLGQADRVVVSSRFFRESLADDLRADEAFPVSFRAICPVIVMQGLASDQVTGRHASHVQVYGVDDRFWRFHDVSSRRGPTGREAFLSRALASDIGSAEGGTVLVRVELPSAIPIESLHGRKENLGRTLRLAVRGVIGPADLGDFSMRPQQSEVRAVFVPLKRLQVDLNLDGRVNVLLLADRPGASGSGATALQALVRRRAQLEDVGLRLRIIQPIGAGEARGTSPAMFAVESAGALIDEVRASAVDAAARDAGLKAQPVLTYLVNSLRSGGRQVVTVQHVTVGDGGQALVAGNMRTGGRRRGRKSK